MFTDLRNGILLLQRFLESKMIATNSFADSTCAPHYICNAIQHYYTFQFLPPIVGMVTPPSDVEVVW